MNIIKECITPPEIMEVIREGGRPFPEMFEEDDACKILSALKEVKTTKRCRNCRETFPISKKWQEYCSNICRTEHYNKMKKVFKKKSCGICNKLFSPKSMAHKYCSDLCRTKQSRKRNEELRNQIYAGKGKTYYRLRMRFEIFKRDNFTCQYCGRNVKEDGVKLQGDHIVPISKGGSYEIKNLITSCEDCNLGKADVLLSLKRSNR